MSKIPNLPGSVLMQFVETDAADMLNISIQKRGVCGLTVSLSGNMITVYLYDAVRQKTAEEQTGNEATMA